MTFTQLQLLLKVLTNIHALNKVNSMGKEIIAMLHSGLELMIRALNFCYCMFVYTMRMEQYTATFGAVIAPRTFLTVCGTLYNIHLLC